jgi:hypothetical protein
MENPISQFIDSTVRSLRIKEKDGFLPYSSSTMILFIMLSSILW